MQLVDVRMLGFRMLMRINCSQLHLRRRLQRVRTDTALVRQRITMDVRGIRRRLLSVVFILCALWIAAPNQANAASVEIENLCVLRPGETYGLWTRDYRNTNCNMNLNLFEVVSSNNKVVRFAGAGKNEYGATLINITGKKKGTAKILLRDRKTHKTVASCKVIVAKYTMYTGHGNLTPLKKKKPYSYAKAKIAGKQITISGYLGVAKNHRKTALKKVKKKKYKLTSKTIYGYYGEGIFYGGSKAANKKTAKRNLKKLCIGCDIYIANGKVLLIGFWS